MFGNLWFNSNVENDDKYNEFLKEIMETNYSTFYRGTVVDNTDPMNSGRVRVRIPQIYGSEEQRDKDIYVPTYAIPWATSAIMAGAGNNTGAYLIPNVGDTVFVTFENGDPKLPMYFGGIITRNGKNKFIGTDDVNGGRLYKASDNDFNTDITNRSQRVLYKSIKGATILIDDKDGDESIKIIDQLGQFISLENVGGETLNRDRENSTDVNLARSGRIVIKDAYEDSIALHNGEIHIKAPKLIIETDDLQKYGFEDNDSYPDEVAKAYEILGETEEPDPEPEPPEPTGDYVYNNSDRCIETGIVMSSGNTYKVEVQFEPTDLDFEEESWVFSAYDEGYYFRLGNYSSSETDFNLDGSNTSISPEGRSTGVIYTATCEYTPSINFASTSPITIFSQSEQGFHPYPNRYFKGKIYYLKIWENNTLVRDFIPEGDGFRDQVSGAWFTWYSGDPEPDPEPEYDYYYWRVENNTDQAVLLGIIYAGPDVIYNEVTEFDEIAALQPGDVWTKQGQYASYSEVETSFSVLRYDMYGHYNVFRSWDDSNTIETSVEDLLEGGRYYVRAQVALSNLTDSEALQTIVNTGKLKLTRRLPITDAEAETYYNNFNGVLGNVEGTNTVSFWFGKCLKFIWSFTDSAIYYSDFYPITDETLGNFRDLENDSFELRVPIPTGRYKMTLESDNYNQSLNGFILGGTNTEWYDEPYSTVYWGRRCLVPFMINCYNVVTSGYIVAKPNSDIGSSYVKSKVLIDDSMYTYNYQIIGRGAKVKSFTLYGGYSPNGILDENYQVVFGWTVLSTAYNSSSMFMLVEQQLHNFPDNFLNNTYTWHYVYYTKEE